MLRTARSCGAKGPFANKAQAGSPVSPAALSGTACGAQPGPKHREPNRARADKRKSQSCRTEIGSSQPTESEMFHVDPERFPMRTASLVGQSHRAKRKPKRPMTLAVSARVLVTCDRVAGRIRSAR